MATKQASDDDHVAAKKAAAEARKSEATRKLAENKQHRDAVVAESEARSTLAPTPTQEENDLARLGVPVEPAETSPPEEVKRVLPGSTPAGGYQTRTSHAGGPGPDTKKE